MSRKSMCTVATMVLAGVLCATLGADSLYAATKTWNVGNGVWDTSSSWSPSGVPAASDTCVFGSTGGATRTIKKQNGNTTKVAAYDITPGTSGVYVFSNNQGGTNGYLFLDAGGIISVYGPGTAQLGGTSTMSCGTGTMTIRVNTGAVWAPGRPFTCGGTTIKGVGLVKLDTADGVGTGLITFNNADATFPGYGTLDVNSKNPSWSGLAGNGGTVKNGVAGTVNLTIGGTSTTSSFGGTIISSTGNINLVKVGSGTFTLSGANTYGGTTTINGGTLALTGAGAISTAGITMAGATILDTSAATNAPTVASSKTLNAIATTGATIKGALTLNAGALLTLAYNGTTPTPTFNVSDGALTLNSNATTITVSGTALAVGDYTVISKSGSGVVAGTAGSVTVAGSGHTGDTATLEVVGGQLVLHVEGAAAAASWWSGGSGTWDKTQTNWKDAATGGSDKVFVNGDIVTIDESYSAVGGTITVGEAVNPASVTVNNSTSAYTIAGSFGIGASATLNKQGTNDLTLANPNGFTGDTRIEAGTLTLGHSDALSGSRLDMNSTDTGALNFAAGLGTANVGNLTGSRNITLTDAGSNGVTLSVGGNNAASSEYLGVLSGAGGLTKTGTGIFSLGNASGPAQLYTGTTTISGGKLFVQDGGTLPTGRYALATGATLETTASSINTAGLDGNGGAITKSGNNVAWTVTLGNGNADGSYSGEFVGGTALLSLVKTGSGTQRLGGNANLGGSATTTINDGKLIAAHLGALGHFGAIVNAATLEIANVTLSSQTNLTLNNGAILSAREGTGTYGKAGNPVIASGASVTFATATGSDTLSLTSGVTGGSSSVITAAGPGVVSLSSSSTFAGNWKLTGGTLRLGNGGSLNSRPIELAGGTLETTVAGAQTFASATTVSAASAITPNQADAGAVHDFGTLSINSSVLSVSAGAAITGGTETVAFDSATLADNATFNISNSGAATMKVSLGAVGQTGGARTLTKQGTGQLFMQGANTQSGLTTVSGGTLVVGVSGSIAGDVTVDNGAVLQLNNTAATGLADTATLTLDTTPAAGTVNLSVAGTETIAGLKFGTVSKAAGTWGSLTSSAQHKSDIFTGPGLLLVSSNPGGGATTTTLATITPNPSCGGALDLVATVTGSSPTGDVEFVDGATSLGTATLSGGTATKSVTLSAGEHAAVTAQYLGDDNNNQSTSDAGSVTVNASTAYYLDADDDGFGVTGDTQDLCEPSGDYTATVGGDCDDADAAINPDATEVCDGKDNDCDTETDEGGASLCDDTNGCTDDSCDAGTCNHTNNTASCDDGNACTQTDTCAGGTCVGGNPVVCAALDQCHDAGTCDTGTGACSNPAKENGTTCVDGNACTQTDTCQDGSCVGGNPVVCTASDQCHDAGTCDTGTGVCSNPAKADNTACNDGDACTQTDTCQSGTCAGSDPVVCTALDQCHDVGTCDTGTGLCSNPTKPDNTACSDSNPCTDPDTCQSGVCTGGDPVNNCCQNAEDCDDNNSCTADTCESNQCVHTSTNEGLSCDDGSLCTQTDTCVSGVCTGSNPVTCSAMDDCHDVGECIPATGLCTNPTKADNTACDDGDACTQTDACNAGVCTGSNPVICTAADQCHDVGTCNPATGVCDDPAKADNTACNDGNLCSEGETCQSGVCTGGSPVEGCCNLDTDCADDGNACTAEVCNPETHTCTHPAVIDGTSCSDGNACTQTDTCQSGTCTGSNPVVCSAMDQCHDAGVCAPETGVCSNPEKANGTTCNDSNGCTQTDTCQSGTCTGSNPVVCTALDQCHDVGTCNTGTGACSNPEKADGTTCSDGNACTQTDTCQTGTCTGANPVVCTAMDQCHEVGTCDTGTGACSNPVKENGTSCDDANVCTQTDTCQAGVCTGGDPQTVTVTQQPADANKVLGETATFTAAASGTGVTAKWQKLVASVWTDVANAPPHVTGADTGSLVITTIVAGDAGQYRCVFTGTCASENSNPAELSIAPTITAWSSVMTQGANTYAVAMDPGATPLIEPRRGNLKIRVVFSADMAAISSGEIPVTGATVAATDVQVNGNTLEFVLPNPYSTPNPADAYPLDGKRLTITLAGTVRASSSAKALLAGDKDCQIRCLVGDLSGDGLVAGTDLSIVRDAIRPTSEDGFNGVVSPDNGATTYLPASWLCDVNANGSINVVDMALVRARIGKTAP